MTVLWESNKVDGIVEGTSSESWTCSGISIDSRSMEKGDLFVALTGENGDGHAFLQNAANKGARAALISQNIESPPLPTIRVPDTLKALEKLGIAARERSHAYRIAVTGSVGKTSTKDALKTIFKEQGLTHGSVSSYNNQWGVPLTLSRMPQDTQFAIFEVGMNHPGEIRPLTQMIKPEIVIITSIEEAHTEFFDSIEDIARAKAEIFEGMAERDIVILNRDNPYFDLLSKLAREHDLRIWGFGQTEGADCRLLSWERVGDKSRVCADVGGKQFSYVLPLPGLHWVLNSLAIVSAAYLADAHMEKVITSLALIEAPEGRGRRYTGSFTILDESYNANPASMRAALAVLGQSGRGRKIAVLGDMREMGDRARAHHEDLSEILVENGIDMVFCCGPLMAHLYERLPHSMKGGYAPTSLELLPLVLKEVQPGDTLSIKASLGTRAKPIVEALLDLQRERIS
ncbi:MAG: UDP-N-acetylmuramoyl-tripeptide--D-alanyl-D-alanine ligase [Alphaproteobacteria bacterium]|nr:UDP-N-acetylmuramoyl-tripeptide--D-alanyl-D-alanine ligase [Alphaproteobacteria bacterium]